MIFKLFGSKTDYSWQGNFYPHDITAKTMKSMDKAARLAMLPDYEMFCVDLKDGMVSLISVMYLCSIM